MTGPPLDTVWDFALAATAAPGPELAARTVDPLPTQRTPQSGTKITEVLLVDPDPDTSEPLRHLLTDVGMCRVAEATSLDDVRERIASGAPCDVVLVNLALGHQATAVVAALHAAGWSRIVALAPTADIGPVIDAVGAGANGVLIGRRANPAAHNLPSSIHELSSREIEVIRLVADGRSNKWIGDHLALSALTVKSHLARIGRKLGTGDRAHMVALALRAGVVN